MTALELGRNIAISDNVTPAFALAGASSLQAHITVMNGSVNAYLEWSNDEVNWKPLVTWPMLTGASSPSAVTGTSMGFARIRFDIDLGPAFVSRVSVELFGVTQPTSSPAPPAPPTG